MFTLIIAAFANFFYILNNNTYYNKYNWPDGKKPSEEEDYSYVSKFTGISFIDSMI
jgi:hypothetical protein